MSPESQDLKDTPIPLWSRTTVKLGALATIFLWAIATTYYLVTFIKVEPLNEENKALEQKLSEAEAREKFLATQLNSLQSDYNRLLNEAVKPILHEPEEDATIIGHQIRFTFDYKKHDPYQNYVLEIRPISSAGKKPILLNVLKPEAKVFNLPKSYIGSGEYLWRLIPGYVAEQRSFVQGPASSYRMLRVYDSTVERLKETGILRVGIAPYFSGSFNSINRQGEIQGFDRDLIEWITVRLGSKFEVPDLRVQLIQVPWRDLLPSLARHELDAVISSMTSSKKREETYRGIKFTVGYFPSHQIFISSRPEAKFPQDLAGKKVGVNERSTNEAAARFLLPRFRFQIDNTYRTYEDLYGALETHVIDFALVDDVLTRGLVGKRFYQCGPPLDELLAAFYQTELGRPGENYAIAVSHEPQAKPNLLNEINTLLDSPAGRDQLQELTAKWIRPGS